MQETQTLSLGWEDPLEEGMATHSSILAWRIPMDREVWGLQSMGSQIRGVALMVKSTWLSEKQGRRDSSK